MSCSHKFTIRANRTTYDYKHWGPWGGIRSGHSCCGQCAGFWHCNNECRNICGKPRETLTEVLTLCEHCGAKDTSIATAAGGADVPISTDGNGLKATVTQYSSDEDSVVWEIINHDTQKQHITAVVNVDGKSSITTPRLAFNDRWSTTTPLSPYAGKKIDVNRWRPGFLGLDGTGGAHVTFICPKNGRIIVSIENVL